MKVNNLIPRGSKIMKPEDAAKLVELVGDGELPKQDAKQADINGNISNLDKILLLVYAINKNTKGQPVSTKILHDFVYVLNKKYDAKFNYNFASNNTSSALLTCIPFFADLKTLVDYGYLKERPDFPGNMPNFKSKYKEFTAIGITDKGVGVVENNNYNKFYEFDLISDVLENHSYLDMTEEELFKSVFG